MKKRHKHGHNKHYWGFNHIFSDHKPGLLLYVCITNVGVPHESVLGLTLFLVFINDLPDDVPSRIEIYADDTTLYSSLGKSVFLRR